MLGQMLKIQWKAAWHLLTALSVAALALPIASVRLGWRGDETHVPLYLSELQLWGFFYPALAAVTAMILAVVIWHSDRRGHHVYAMALPLPRWRYVLLRYGAGAVLLAPVVGAVWIGALVATLSIPLPPGLRTFPHLLAVKFALALLTCFAIAFAVAASSARTLGVTVRLTGLFLAAHIAVLLLTNRPQVNLVVTVLQFLMSGPGPLSPLGGRWMLIDV